ncbi:MAG: hypothetical protein HYX34_16205, partial [Actinobacteria bacterium]|nr:hypothetical protein [Actinomycetota bacterium]
MKGSQAEAARALAELVVEVDRGRVVAVARDDHVAVRELVEAYLRHLEVDKGRKHSTLVRYRGLVRCWIGPVIGDKRADRVRPD